MLSDWPVLTTSLCVDMQVNALCSGPFINFSGAGEVGVRVSKAGVISRIGLEGWCESNEKCMAMPHREGDLSKISEAGKSWLQ